MSTGVFRRRYLPPPPVQSSFATLTASPQAAVNAWYVALSEPARSRVLRPSQQQFGAYVGADPFPEAVSIDKWLVPLSEPSRTRRLPPAQHPAVLPDPDPQIKLDWFVPLSEPVRRPQALRTGLHPFEARIAWPDISISWLVPLSEPVRYRVIAVAQQQAFVPSPADPLDLPQPQQGGTSRFNVQGDLPTWYKLRDVKPKRNILRHHKPRPAPIDDTLKPEILRLPPDWLLGMPGTVGAALPDVPLDIAGTRALSREIAAAHEVTDVADALRTIDLLDPQRQAHPVRPAPVIRAAPRPAPQPARVFAGLDQPMRMRDEIAAAHEERDVQDALAALRSL